MSQQAVTTPVWNPQTWAFVTTKMCSQCDVEKPLTDFHVSRQLNLGRASACKECQRKKDHPEAKPKPFRVFRWVDKFINGVSDDDFAAMIASHERLMAEIRANRTTHAPVTALNPKKEAPITKFCSRCRMEKAVPDFGFRPNGMVSSYCRPCTNEYHADYQRRKSKGLVKARQATKAGFNWELAFLRSKYFAEHSPPKPSPEVFFTADMTLYDYYKSLGQID